MNIEIRYTLSAQALAKQFLAGIRSSLSRQEWTNCPLTQDQAERLGKHIKVGPPPKRSPSTSSTTLG